MNATLWLIPAFPLVGAVVAFIVGKKVRDAAGWIATSASVLAFLWTVKSVFTLSAAPLVAASGLEGNSGGTRVLEDLVFAWMHIGTLKLDFLLRFDALTAVMCLVVTGVGSLIHLYSIAYMAEEEFRHRFFSYLNLFMFSMLTLVLAGNLPVLFVGWEGVGLCSYLLIGFWFKNTSYASAGRKAFVVNRIGDAGFLLGMFLLFQQFGSLDFVDLQAGLAHAPLAVGLATIIALCFFVGAAGKSAQIPLFVWLPDAMAGPTPVSALIHAATMVTAGVYLFARMHFLFDSAPDAMLVVASVAVLTAFVAATTAVTQNDIKKVLAYSTVSQLGFMFVAAAVGAYWVAIFHVVTHAFFKACLFLGAGSVIHGCHHEQDMRKMGGLWKKMPITAWTYLISTLAIAGIAPFAGYYSKHAILESLSATPNSFFAQSFLFGTYTSVFGLILNLTALCTAFYMTRSFAMTFLGEYRGGDHGHSHGKHAADDHQDHDGHDHADHGGGYDPHESPWKMTLPLVVLAALALVSGLVLSGHLFDGEYSLQSYLQSVVPSQEHAHQESLVASLMHSWIGILGVVIGVLFYTSLKQLPRLFAKALSPLTKLSQGKWFFDEVYGTVLIRPLEGAARFLWRGIDQGVIDGTVNGTAAAVDMSGEITRHTQTGQIRHYALFMFIGTVLVIAFYMVM